MEYSKALSYGVSSGGFLSLPKEITSIQTGEIIDVVCSNDFGFGIKTKDKLKERLISVIGQPLVSEWQKSPFSDKVITKVQKALKDKKEEFSTFAYNIAKFEIDDVSFVYLLPRNFVETNMECQIERKTNNEAGYSVFEISQK